jgi:hypothetical protein
MKDQKPAKKKEAAGKPEFKGRITSISCANDVAEFRFEVENKKDEATRLFSRPAMKQW